MKFAYLIMAHNNPEQLKILLKLLDHKENDIYLHIDKRNHDISVPDIVKCVKSASLHVYRKLYKKSGRLCCHFICFYLGFPVLL